MIKRNQSSVFKCQMSTKQGFSLIEVLVTLMILSVGIVAISALMAGNIRTSVNAKNQIIASGLAQEGVELVKNLKDARDNAGTSPTFSADIPIGNDYRIDYDSDYATFKSSNIVSVAQKKLNSSSEGYFLHSGIVGTGGVTGTKFLRKVKISTTADGDKKVESVVSWNSASIPAGTVADPCNVAKKCVSVQAVLPNIE